jgi:PAS domain S-box-containing protein
MEIVAGCLRVGPAKTIMRVNQPVTQNEYVLREGALIVSTTDLKGRITSVNPEFLQVSGFSEDELIGKAHNIVRHPDMPEAAFADFWQTLQAGRPWTGLVKNRRKDGDFYWVVANATPVREGGAITGYMSVRTKATAGQIRNADELYRRLSKGDSVGWGLREGRVVRRRGLDAFNILRNVSRSRQSSLIDVLISLLLLTGMVSLLMPNLANSPAVRDCLAGLLAFTGLSWLYRARRARHNRSAGALACIAFIEDMAEGRHSTAHTGAVFGPRRDGLFDGRDDEYGQAECRQREPSESARNRRAPASGAGRGDCWQGSLCDVGDERGCK